MICPQCKSDDVVFTGGGKVVDFHIPLFEWVDFWRCQNCGYFDYEFEFASVEAEEQHESIDDVPGLREISGGYI